MKPCTYCNGRGVIFDDGYRGAYCDMPSGYVSCPACNSSDKQGEKFDYIETLHTEGLDQKDFEPDKKIPFKPISYRLADGNVLSGNNKVWWTPKDGGFPPISIIEEE